MTVRYMEVVQDSDGSWMIREAGGRIISDGMTNREAWRRLDILRNEALSKSQDTASWAFNKDANRE